MKVQRVVSSSLDEGGDWLRVAASGLVAGLEHHTNFRLAREALRGWLGRGCTRWCFGVGIVLNGDMGEDGDDAE